VTFKTKSVTLAFDREISKEGLDELMILLDFWFGEGLPLSVGGLIS
jgi:hypothetical protein